MKKEKMKILDDIVKLGEYKFDIFEGKIFNKKGKEMGRNAKLKKHTKEHKVCTLLINKEKYNFTNAEIIAYLSGMFDGKENPEKYAVYQIDRNVNNCMYLNLRVELKSNLVKNQHLNKNLSTKQLDAYKQKSIDPKVSEEIKELYSFGFKPIMIAKEMGVNYHTVQKYCYSK